MGECVAKQHIVMFFVCVGLPGTAGTHFVPVQAEGMTMQQLFGEVTPTRLSGFSVGTVTMMNDWHYPMLNDHNRTAFYKAMLTESVTGDSVVLDLGAGTGLLSVLAAQAGAKRVYAVEANRELAEAAREVIQLAGFADRVTVYHTMSTELQAHQLPEPANVLVSEIFGTLLLTESAEVYVADAFHRGLLHKSAQTLPQIGEQLVQLVSAPELVRLSAATETGGVDLSRANSFRDTVSLRYSKMLGVPLRYLGLQPLAPPAAVLQLDFRQTPNVKKYHKASVRADRSGVVHALLATWNAWPDHRRTHLLTTDLNITADNLPRTLSWGQGIQMVDPFNVQVGDNITLHTRWRGTDMHIQPTFQRCDRRLP